MACNTLWQLCFFLLTLTTSFVYTSDVNAIPHKQTIELQLEEVIKNLREENAILRRQVELLQQRDVESDIAEIRAILKSYGEDITNLRINQV